MQVIYENEVRAIGDLVDSFEDADFIIMFGQGAPADLADCCYTVDVNPVNGEIKPGQVLSFGDQSFTITAVGEEAPVTLKGLGHCTVRFNGATEPELPGTIYVEQAPVPTIGVGTKIRIVEE